MPGYKVITKNTGKVELFSTEYIPISMFGKFKWEKMKRGDLLPFIEVEEIESVEEMQSKDSNDIEEDLKLMSSVGGHELPWASDDKTFKASDDKTFKEGGADGI